ncbi:MAG: glycosyltransferase family 4 protein [Bacteriovoracaceae bacterium]|nr:glycosyltransferase family 4 protein [Bacteriovoracaceae bacterium]
MRIGFEAKRAFHNFVGLGNYARSLLQGLGTYYPEHEYWAYTPPFKDERAKIWAANLPPAVKVCLPHGLGRLCPAAWRSAYLTKTIKKDKLDIFHGLSHELPSDIQDWPGKKIVTMHDLIFLRYPEYFSKIDRYIFNKKFSFAAAHADMVVAISESTKRDLMEILHVPEEKIRVIYQTCNPIFYEEVSPDLKESLRCKYNLPYKYILYVGSFTKRKNVISLVKALKLAQQINDIPLVLIGRGEVVKEQIRDLAQQEKISRKIIFLENIPTNHLPALYQNATVFVYPSLFEGFGIPIIEALFSKIPVITSLGSCFREAGGVGQIYVDPHQPEQIGQAIIEVTENEELRQKMIKAGTEHVQRFREENTLKAMMQLYQSLS